MDIQTVAETTDAVGGFSETETVVHDDVPCRIRNVSGFERNVQGAEGKEITHRIYCNTRHQNVDVVVRPRDKILFDDGRKFDIFFVNNPHELDEFFQIDVQEFV